MVKVEVTLVFRILKAKEFVYTLGATKFDDALKAVAEEAIRANVRAVKHNHVYELRGSGTDTLLKNLNSRFEIFGVLFTNAQVVNVQLPPDLASALENATTYDAKMRNQIRSQEFALKLLNDDNDKQLKALNLENERLSAAEVARKDRVVIDLQTTKSNYERNKQLSVIKAQQDASVMKTNVQTAMDSELLLSQSALEVAVKQAQGQATSKRVAVEQDAETKRLQSEAVLIEAQNNAKAIAVEAEAESRVFEQLQAKRSYDLSMSQSKALSNVASKSKIIITGKDAKEVISAMTKVSKTGTSDPKQKE